MTIHEKYPDSAIEKFEHYVNDFIRSEAGFQRQKQCNDVREYSVWQFANTSHKIALEALTEMGEWYSHHPLKEFLEKELSEPKSPAHSEGNL